jgi:uncharacterized coiled-coil protein SlyX
LKVIGCTTALRLNSHVPSSSGLVAGGAVTAKFVCNTDQGSVHTPPWGARDVLAEEVMPSDPFEDLQVRYSHLEKAQAELSEVVWRQQKQLDELEKVVRSLSDRLGGDPGLVDSSRVDLPPHY